MTKIGRNEPCPCGSGKKYKHCCWKRDRVEVSDSRLQELAADELFRQIARMAQSSPAVDFASASDLYWDGKFSPENAGEMGRGEQLQFLDWYAFDYRTSQARARMIDLVGEQELGEAHRALWERWREVPISLYRVEDRSPAGKVTLRDLLREEEPLVQDLTAGQDIGVGDILAARVLPAGKSHILLAPPIVLAADGEEEIVGLARERYQNYRQAHSEASWEDFLRENSYMFNHYALRLSGWRPSTKIHLPGEALQLKVRVEPSGLITLAEGGEKESVPQEKVSPSGIILPMNYEE